MDHPREVHPKEGKAGVRNWIDQVLTEVRHNLDLGLLTTQFRDTVAMQPGAVHYVVRFEGTDGTLDDDLRLIGLYCRDARRRHDSALRFIHTLRQTPAELLIIDNTSLRDVMGLDACCVCGKPWPDLAARG